MPLPGCRNKICCLLVAACTLFSVAHAQTTNLLLNGGFEDVNTCSEYDAECGVEAWFYLKDVKAQMLANESNTRLLGANSFGIFFNWLGYTGFSPLIGTLLPCGLQKDKQYIFSGLVSAKLNPKLILQAGVSLGTTFYVPKRPFVTGQQPDSIVRISKIPNSNFFRFSYTFTATGTERYLTFGTYIKEDTTGAKKKLIGTQTVSVVLDNFELLPLDEAETGCDDYAVNKEAVYRYNFRHKEMDYSLYGRGDLKIVFDREGPPSLTQYKKPAPPLPVLTVPDTLKLGDVFFDFNQSTLKPGALNMLAAYFSSPGAGIDSMYIEGHTDSVGSDRQNLALSRQRCESVQRWLLERALLPAAQLSVRPYGRSRPVATNRTAAGRALNRRVELIIFRKKGS